MHMVNQHKMFYYERVYFICIYTQCINHDIDQYYLEAYEKLGTYLMFPILLTHNLLIAFSFTTSRYSGEWQRKNMYIMHVCINIAFIYVFYQ